MYRSAKFEENFWGEGNRGYEVLLQNLRIGMTASKELGDFIKERASLEDSYVKGLGKLQKTVGSTTDTSLGGFAPLWHVLRTMCDELSKVHSEFVHMLNELAREIGEYNANQKDKLKSNLRGEVEAAGESLQTFESCSAAVTKTQRLYQQSCDQLSKWRGKLEKANGDPSATQKVKQTNESRVKQAELWVETMKTDHQESVRRHCEQLMEFQGKMVEACQKFESLEEEHLAQMVTFMIKISQAQDNSHVRVERVYQTVNEQLNILSVEKLMSEFIGERGTGKEKPAPFKFKPVIAAPSSLSTSHEEEVHTVTITTTLATSTATATSTEPRKSSEGGKGFRSRLRKLARSRAGSHAHSTEPPQQSSNGPVPAATPDLDNSPEVDEEGYSIRPQDAASISQFPDDPGKRWDSDSDSDFEEPEAKLKKLHIKAAPDHLPQASVDDIKASVMSLRLGMTSPGGSSIRKATSSQSLNILSTESPSADRRQRSPVTMDDGGLLLDLSIPSGGVPPPLPPTSYNPSILLAPIPDPTETLTPWSVGATASEAPPGPRPVPRPRSGSKSSPETQRRSEPSPERTPPVPKRRSPPAPTLTKVEERPPEAKSSPSPPARPHSSFPLTPISAPPSVSATPESSTPSGGESTSFNTRNVSAPVLVLSPSEAGPVPADTMLTPPVPAPRRNTVGRKRGSLPGNIERPASPLTTAQFSVQGPTLAPPTSSRGQTPPTRDQTPPASSQGQAAVSSSTAKASQVVPIAVAFHETCNAIFKGTELAQCVNKVTGEMVVSFPTSFIPQIASHELLSFHLSGTDRLEGVRHNQQLLQKKEGDEFVYQFNMQALLVQLKQLSDTKRSPFHNLNVLKYEVKVSDTVQLPLKLVCYWKCDSAITNFRLDYTYQPSALRRPGPNSAHKFPLTGVIVSVPVNGGVSNALSKPTGTWVPDQDKMVWKVGEASYADQPDPSSLHAKFEVGNGPSSSAPALVQFLCNGATVSGVTLELDGNAYKLSLLKHKCSSGKYTAEATQ